MPTSRTLVLMLILVLGGCSHESAQDTHRTSAHRGASTSGGHASDGEEEHPPAVHPRPSRTAQAEPSDVPAPSAQDQSSETGDVEITRQFRVALVEDGSLSWGARSVVIVTQSAVVTLRGDVDTEAERRTIERHVHAITGVTRVDNQLHVAP